MMKLSRILVDTLEEIAPEAHSKFVTHPTNKKILRASMLRPSHGMLKVSLLCCKKMHSTLMRLDESQIHMIHVQVIKQLMIRNMHSRGTQMTKNMRALVLNKMMTSLFSAKKKCRSSWSCYSN